MLIVWLESPLSFTLVLSIFTNYLQCSEFINLCKLNLTKLFLNTLMTENILPEIVFLMNAEN